MKMRKWMGLVWLIAAAPLMANDWPAWRGPEQTGQTREKAVVTSWSEGGENLLWKLDIGGRSTPIVMDGRVYDLVDNIDVGERKSETAHSFGIEGAKQDWKANQSFAYPDGKKVKSRGRSHVGGTSKWTIQNLTPGKDVVIAKRIDFVRGGIVTRMEVDGKTVGDWKIEGSDRKARWRNWLFEVPGDAITKTEAECRQVAVEAERDINMFGLWFYQARS